MNKPTGADCNIRWFKGNLSPSFSGYISFGHYDEDRDTDAHGRADDTVFYYCDDEAELIKLMDKNNGGDFVVLSYELNYESFTTDEPTEAL